MGVRRRCAARPRAALDVPAPGGRRRPGRLGRAHHRLGARRALPGPRCGDDSVDRVSHARSARRARTRASRPRCRRPRGVPCPPGEPAWPPSLHGLRADLGGRRAARRGGRARASHRRRLRARHRPRHARRPLPPLCCGGARLSAASLRGVQLNAPATRLPRRAGRDRSEPDRRRRRDPRSPASDGRTRSRAAPRAARTVQRRSVAARGVSPDSADIGISTSTPRCCRSTGGRESWMPATCPATRPTDPATRPPRPRPSRRSSSAGRSRSALVATTRSRSRSCARMPAAVRSPSSRSTRTSTSATRCTGSGRATRRRCAARRRWTT